MQKNNRRDFYDVKLWQSVFSGNQVEIMNICIHLSN